MLLKKKEVRRPWEFLNENISRMFLGEILPKCELCLGVSL